MVTQNPRIAAYVPQVIKEQFEAFKSDRKIKGDSQALIIILSEYFGVSHPVAHQVDYSDFVRSSQFDELQSKVSSLAEKVEGVSKTANNSPSELFSELLRRIEQLEKQLKYLERSNLSEEVKRLDEVSSGQMSLLDVENSNLNSESSGDTPPEEPKQAESAPGAAAKQTLGLGELGSRWNRTTPSISRAKKNLSPEKFIEWSRKRDPNGVAWEYLPELNRFRPVGMSLSELVSEPVDF